MECAISEWLEMVIAQSILLLWRMCQYGAMLYRSWNVQTMLASATGWSCLCMFSQSTSVYLVHVYSFKNTCNLHIHVDIIDFLIISHKECPVKNTSQQDRSGSSSEGKAQLQRERRPNCKNEEETHKCSSLCYQDEKYSPRQKGGSQTSTERPQQPTSLLWHPQ